jgi:uncharacterized damage-inducible protein DinB
MADIPVLQDPRRSDPPLGADERTSLDAWLEYHRATLLLKCEGLDATALRRRPVLGSLMSLHGLIRHMTEVERGWFRRTIGGEDAPRLYYDPDTAPEGDFEIPDDRTFEVDLAAWHAETEACRAVAASKGLDDTGTHGTTGETIDLRWVYLHMIEEYARHNGHADLLRELVGGSVFE